MRGSRVWWKVGVWGLVEENLSNKNVNPNKANVIGWIIIAEKLKISICDFKPVFVIRTSAVKLN